MSVKVNMTMQEQGVNSSGTLAVTVTEKGWPHTINNGAVISMPKPRVYTFTDGVFSEDVNIDVLGNTHWYSFVFVTDASTYKVDAKLPNNYHESTIDFADLQFKGAL